MNLKIITVILMLSMPIFSFGQIENDIIILEENFDKNPGWENYNNRVKAIDPPVKKQNFGWALTNNNGDGPGEIGGTIWRSSTASYYAMPLGKPLNFKEPFSASGKISVIAPEEEGYGFYIGFFGHERQGWRVWSSCGARIGKFAQEFQGSARWYLDYKTGNAAGAILNSDLLIPGDGSVYKWELKFEPNISVADYKWLDARVSKYLEDGRSIRTDSILVMMQKDVPSMTKERLLKILFDARDKGIVDDWYRKGKFHIWNLELEPEKIKGKITFTFDDKSVSYFLVPGHQEHPATINRFGFWNMQIYNGSLEFYVSDLVVNGHKIDLTQDPHWEGLNNQVTFLEKDFHARQSFAFTQTNWAGENPGEIGGRFWGTEVIDPLNAYYGTDIGNLSLEDPIRFTGKINFTEGAVDGRMLIGYFNKNEIISPVEGEYKGNPPHQYLGLQIMDQTRIGYYFAAVCSPRQDIAIENHGPICIPDRIRRAFVFDYDPNAGDAGRITVTFGQTSFTTDLTTEQRKIGSKFNRFGLLNPRKGGKYVDVYIDDITYSSRKSKSEIMWHEQNITKEPYPKSWGRKYR